MDAMLSLGPDPTSQSLNIAPHTASFHDNLSQESLVMTPDVALWP